MTAIKALLWFEWLQLRRSKSFWVLNIIFCLISLYAAWYGSIEVKQQQRKIELVKYTVDTTMNALRVQLQHHDSVAWEYEPLYKTVIYNKPDGMAAIAFGQRDLHKFAIEISEGTYYYNKYATGYTNKTLSGEINNPQKQLAGHLDISFVIVFLLPLYFILLSYNILSGEKEQGTLSMLGIQQLSIRQLFYSKLLVRWLATIALSFAMILIAAIITGALADGRLWVVVFVTFLYSLFWAALLSIITAMHRPSGFNALLLISSWLFVCILLPALFNAVLKATYPTLNKTKLTAAVQKANAEVFAMNRMEVADSFYKFNPQYNNKPGDTLPNGWYNPRWMRAVHAVLDNRVLPAEKEYHLQLRKQIETANKMNIGSPALLAQDVLVTIAASNMGQMLAYDTAAWTYFKTWNNYLDESIFFRENKFTKTDFDNLPKYIFKPQIDFQSIVLKLVLLFVWALIPFLAGYFLMQLNFKQY